MSLAAQIATWYQAVFQPRGGETFQYAIAQITSSQPFVITYITAARSREEAIGAMRLTDRPSNPTSFLAVIGPYGIEGTRA